MTRSLFAQPTESPPLASRILVIDDHQDSRTICEIILARHGYGTSSAGDAATGLELARTTLPDLIILDIALPAQDGWSVIEQLRNHPATIAIPVVLYTAHPLEPNRARAVDMGCAGFLAKPCPPREIVSVVDRVLAGRPPGG